ncbi:MAG: glutamine--fructose-6-phosphate transaminase (isomerizing) [Candidatus Hodarchaeota archaeon]
MAICADTENVAPMITKGLKRLEYRGYDSVGVAMLDESGITLRKDAGTVDDVVFRLRLASLKGKIGMGHTRWATHGPPLRSNAHPHSDCLGKIAVIHNGIIENYLEIRSELKERGHEFKSETDTEVMAHLIEEYMVSEDLNLKAAFAKALERVQGAYAFVVMSIDEPDKIVLSKRESPMVIGLGQKKNFAASDMPAFLEHTKEVIILHDEDIVTMSSSFVTIESRGHIVHRRPTEVMWTAEMAQKGGYPHFMLKEIHEQPTAIRTTLQSISPSTLADISKMIGSAERIVTLACGTSHYAALHGANSLSRVLQRPVWSVIASEADTHEVLFDENTLCLTISQSGETIDIIRPLKWIKDAGTKVVAISNVVDSTIPRMAIETLYTRAGPEIGVAATKTHTSQIALLNQLALTTGREFGTLQPKESEELMEILRAVPKELNQTILQLEIQARRLASRLTVAKSAYFLARGNSLPVAMEGALKLKEIAYIHAEAYPAGESKHGPIALVEKEFPVFFMVPNDKHAEVIKGNLEEMKARGGRIIAVTEKACAEVIERADESFVLPVTRSDPITNGILMVVPLQMIAYYAAVTRGYNADLPRNLAKAVTVA